MPQIIILISLALYIFVNYLAIKNKSVWSWLCILIWVALSIICSVTVLNFTKDFQSFVKEDNITIYLILSTLVILGNLALSLYYFFKKSKT
jgi:hypothetical protein